MNANIKLILLFCLFTLGLNANSIKADITKIDDICEKTPTQECKNNKDDVKLLQEVLNRDKMLHVKIDEDGKWGKKTKEAVIKFQKLHHISPTEGYVGYKTKMALKKYVKLRKNKKSIKLAKSSRNLKACLKNYSKKSKHKIAKSKKIKRTQYRYTKLKHKNCYKCYEEFKRRVNLKKSYAVYTDKKLLAKARKS